MERNAKLRTKVVQNKDYRNFLKLVHRVISSTKYYSSFARNEEIKRLNKKSLIDHEYLSIGAKVDDKYVGFLIGYYDADLFLIDWMGVDKSFRGQGIAKEIINYTEKYLQGKARKIWFDSRTSNKEAMKFYEKMSYKRIAILKNHWYGHDYFLWEKKI